jgi:hypothetical protein
MRRTVRTALGCLVLLAATAVAAQTQPAATSDYYPLKVGTKWVYKVGETTITVKVASADGSGAVLDTMVNDKSVATEVIQVKADGIYRTKINKADITPGVKILELKDGKPAPNGTEWGVDSKVQDQPVKGKYKLTGDKEKVKVPSGEYEAVVVDGPAFEIAGTKTGVKYWFAPKLGIVKLTYNIAGNEAILELKEFTEGK